MLVAKAVSEAGAYAEILGSRLLAEGSAEVPPVLRRLPDDRWGQSRGAGLVFYLRRALTWSGSALVVYSAVLRRRPDIVHFQAPINRRLDAHLVRRLARRVPVVWTAHDVLPFERTQRDADWFVSIYRAVDRVIVHTDPAALDIRRLAGVDPIVIPHPVPDDITLVSPAEARRQLGVPAEGRILAALGFIRAYKGYGLLADVWEQLGDDAPLLLVMGELIAGEEQATLDRLRRSRRVELRLGYASEDELKLAAIAADAILLPHEVASDSGLLHLARAVGVPVLASDAPQLAAAVESSGAGVILRRLPEAWVAAVTGQLPPAPPTPPKLHAVGERHMRVYESVLDRKGAELRPFRLAVYTDAELVGGAERVLADLVAALDPIVDVVVVGTDLAVVDWIASHRKRATAFLVPAVRDKRDIGSILAHWRAIKEVRPAIFQANLRHPWSCQYGLAAALLAPGLKVLAVEHLPTPPTARVQRMLKRLTSRRLDAHIGVGYRSARELEALIGLAPGAIGTIPNGVAWRESPARPRFFPGPTVAAVGRLTPQKGIDLLLAALAALPDICAVVAGDGPERARLERQRDELELRNRVRFVGWVEDVSSLLAAVDCFALPSRYEAFPLVVLEAMHAGLPVVAADVGSVREAVVPDETGFLVPADDVGSLRDALRQALEPATAARLGKRSREVAKASFSADRMARDYERLYRRLVA